VNVRCWGDADIANDRARHRIPPTSASALLSVQWTLPHGACPVIAPTGLCPADPRFQVITRVDNESVSIIYVITISVINGATMSITYLYARVSTSDQTLDHQVSQARNTVRYTELSPTRFKDFWRR
jgi:hypothetical protein